jgi:hypothetical protein
MAGLRFSDSHAFCVVIPVDDAGVANDENARPHIAMVVIDDPYFAITEPGEGYSLFCRESKASPASKEGARLGFD